VVSRQVGLHRLAAVASIGAVTALGGAACSPGPLTPPTHGAPMNKPVPVGRNDDAGGAMELARRQLQGTWELIALEYSLTSDGARVPVQATGTLSYDDFGNLTIDAHTSDQAAPVAAREVNKLSFTGRAVIDAARRELKMMDLTGNANPDEVLSPERRRRYEFGDDTLKLSSFDDGGQVTAISTWRRRQ
jgi:hypothetical protein